MLGQPKYVVLYSGLRSEEAQSLASRLAAKNIPHQISADYFTGAVRVDRLAEAPARFAEMLATIKAGYGVLIKRGETVVCRLVPESAFAPPEPDEDQGLTPEQKHAKEVLGAFQSMMNDEF